MTQHSMPNMIVLVGLLLLLFCSTTTVAAFQYQHHHHSPQPQPRPTSWTSKQRQHPIATSTDHGRRLRQHQAEKSLRRIPSSSRRHHYLAASSPANRDQEELPKCDDDHQRAVLDDTDVKSSSSSSSSRREFMRVTTAGLSAATVAACMAFAGNANVAAAIAINIDSSDSDFTPAIRPTAYRVDSTIPPTLLPLQGARQEVQILQSLGRGSGTNKEAVFVDTINLNNMLNKAVFGTINQVSALIPSTSGTSSSLSSNQQSNSKGGGPGYASFVCLGVPMEPSPVDIELAVTLLQTMFQVRNKGGGSNTALGLAFLPYSTQSALDEYVTGITRSQADLFQTLMQEARVAESTLQLYAPLFDLAKSSRVSLLAMAPEAQDLETLRQKGNSGGLQNVNPERRAQYVVDPQGFIALSKDERFDLYTERSLLKDFNDNNANDANDKGSKPSDTSSSSSSVGNYFAERILVHEAGATAMARFAAAHASSSSSSPESAPLVAMVAPMNDVRYLNGMNGRIPRIYQTLLNPDSVGVVTKNAVSTILINPTAADTLSKTRHLRLEIGTGPETLDYQTKIADYLWFSSSPKVNLIPRLMDYPY
jgi:Haem-binding uptake, Tiki superfamily, ChaN